MKEKIQISPSTLKIMYDCPCCFWWILKEKARRPDHKQPLANQIDARLKLEFDTYREKFKMPTVLNKLEDTGIKLCNDWQLVNKCRNGIVFEDEQRAITLFGKMDDLLEKNGKLVVFDFKTTGKNNEKCTKEHLNEDINKYHYTEQLGFYSHLLRKNKYETEDYGYLLFYFIEEFDNLGNAVFGTEAIKINLDLINIQKDLDKALQILNLEEPPEPGIKNGKMCEYCLYVDKRPFKCPKCDNSLLKKLKIMAENPKMISDKSNF